MLFKTTCALIAGEGKMPQFIVETMKERGQQPLILALEESTLKLFQQQGFVGYHLHPIQLGKACQLMQKHGVHEVTFAGRIPHRVLLDIRPWHLSLDIFFLWLSLPDTRADTVLRALCDYFQKNGIHVLDSIRYLSRYLLQKTTKEKLSSDALLGIAVAKTLGAMDVGQTVVVKKGTVMALEAMEGTNKCLDRAIELGSCGATLIKMAKPAQDMRFDVPVIGEATFARLHQGGFRALVVEEDKTLCLDLEALEKAKAKGLEVYVVGPKEIEQALASFQPKWN